MYQLMYNNAAGEFYINERRSPRDPSQEGHFQEVALCSSEDELEKRIRELAGPTVYAVFENGPAGEVFVSEENGISGNWRGSKYGYFSLVGEYSSQEAADLDAQSRQEYFASLESP